MKLIQYVHQGGPIMYLLLLLNILGFSLMIYKFFSLNKEDGHCEQTSEALKSLLNTGTQSFDSNTMIELSKGYVSEHMGQVEKGVSFVKTIATISPLLGLLGTVIGVLSAFQVMSQTGLNNPEHFAQGISLALITTVGGLIVAIPHFIGYNILLSKLDQLELKLEKKVISKVLS